MELPRWKCHKVVQAAKILGVQRLGSGQYALLLTAGDPRDSDQWFGIDVGAEYVASHSTQPLVGGYYVRYEDGYESWSPAKAFEQGYARVQV